MNNCEKCCMLTEVVGGDRLTYWCKDRNEKIVYPALVGRFCPSFVPIDKNDEEVNEDA